MSQLTNDMREKEVKVQQLQTQVESSQKHLKDKASDVFILYPHLVLFLFRYNFDKDFCLLLSWRWSLQASHVEELQGKLRQAELELEEERRTAAVRWLGDMFHCKYVSKVSCSPAVK